MIETFVHRVRRSDMNVNRHAVQDKQLVENLVAHALRDDGALVLHFIQLNDELMGEREGGRGGEGGSEVGGRRSSESLNLHSAARALCRVFFDNGA